MTGIEKIVPSLAMFRSCCAFCPLPQPESLLCQPDSAEARGRRRGPEAFHVVLVVNGRSALCDPGARVLHCIRLRRLHEPLPRLWGDRRPPITRSIRAAGRCAGSRLDGIAKTYDLPNASSFAAAVRGLSGEDSAHPHYAVPRNVACAWPSSRAFSRGLELWASVAPPQFMLRSSMAVA